MEIKDTAAVVTGGASGLGAATVEALAARGASVFALDVAGRKDEEPRAAAAAREPVRHLDVDVTDQDAVRQAIDTVVADGPSLRIVVNCAGIDRPRMILDADGAHDLELFRKVVEVNLIGTFVVMSIAAEAMTGTEELPDGQRGVIVNTASTLAFEGQAGQSAYASSKAGVIGLTLPAARDLAPHGIRVVTISPGIFETAMTTGLTGELRAAGLAQRFLTGMGSGPSMPKRYGHPEEFARVVEMLVEQDYVNGTDIRLDAGLHFGTG